MAPVAKRKNETAAEAVDESEVVTAPTVSKKRKHDLSWFVDGLASEDPFPVLKQFIDSADQFLQRGGKKAEHGDIVKNFFEKGGTGSEIISLLGGETKRNASETSLVFTTLEKIFMRCSQDLSEYRDLVMKTANTIVQSYMVKIYMTMAPSSNANQIKSALRLLISMVTLSHVTAREVIARFDFNHACVDYILKRRSLVDVPDVRTTYVMFIISLIMEEDNMVLRTLSENLAILRPVFAGLIFDSAGVVQLFLTALHDKVVMSGELNKSHKMRIFNTMTLQLLSRLFFWLGPKKAPKKHMNQDEGTLDNDQPIDEATEEELIVVSETLQSLFITLTSSHKHGIAFADHDLGLGSQNKNSMVFCLLETLGDFWERACPRLVELQTELVVKALIGCPDLVRQYTSEISRDLAQPRMSRAYTDLCSMVKEIIKSQNVTIVFNPREKYTVKQQSKRAAALIAPYALGHEIFVAGLSDESAGVKVAVGEILLAILDKAIEFQEILKHHPKAKMYTDQERTTIFANFKEMLRVVVPASSVVTESCSQLSTRKDRSESIDYWAVLLKLLARYSSLGLVKEETPIPASLIVNDIVECVEESNLEEHVLENLVRSMFDYVNSLPDLSRIAGAQQRALIGQIVKHLAVTRCADLRQAANALLFKIIAPITGMSQVELDVWTTCLERHPACCPFLIATLKELHMSHESIERPRFALLTSAWKSAAHDDEVNAYATAVTCELLLVQNETDVKPFAEFALKTAAATLGPLLKAFTKTKSKYPKEIASLGANSLASSLYETCLSSDASLNDFENSLREAGNRPDVLRVALNQCMTCIAIARSRDADAVQLVNVLRLVQESEVDAAHSMSRLFLTHTAARNWFDPTMTDEAFIGAVNSIVHDALARLADPELDRNYQLRFVECIERLVKSDETVSLQDDRDVALSLSQLKIQDVEPLVSLVVDSKDPSESWRLKYLDMFLQRVARLRLEGPSQRIAWSVFQRVLKLFTELGATSGLLKGINDVVSVCPEFLDSVDDFTPVTKACLDCENDRTDICGLLITNSSQLRSSFGNWCLENEQHFESINWRLGLLPAYFESDYDDAVLTMLHKKLTPKFKEILINGTGYRTCIGQSPGVEEFMRFLISKCWTNEDCGDVTDKLLHQAKGEVVAVQFSEAGRHGNRQDAHLKLCVRSVIRQFKSEESADLAETKRIADELDWLAKQTKYDAAELGKLVLHDANWSKFLKYTLRIGLRAMTSSESPLPPIALRIMANVLRLFLASRSDETEKVSKQMFDMITSHSDFMTVIMDEEDSYPEQKRLLLQLLTVLVEVNPKLCQGSQVPLLLASYRAKRSIADQLILGLLRAYEKNDVKLSPYKPYLWGPTAAVHYSIQRSGTASKLSQQPAAGEVIALLDGENLLKTAYNFPNELVLNSCEQVAVSDQYDPRFLLPVLAHILSAIYSVQCAKFTQTGAVSLLFASLSSSCGEMRALGWLALSRLNEQIQNAVAWPERCLWLHLIECVRLGAAEYFRDLPPSVSRQHPPRLSSIVTLFLAKAAAIIRDPLHPMYRTVNNFLVVKPVMDVTQVPEFFVMMHSTELPEQKALHRSFLLGLLKDGMKSRQDYLVCARRRVFRILLSFQPSELLADKATKSMILEVIQSALRNPIIAYDLIRNRGLIMWLDGLLLGQNRGAVVAHQLLNVVETLWNTLYSHLLEKRNLRGANEEEAVAELEREVEAVEAEDADESQKKNKKIKEEKDNKTNNPYSRKPIWNMLPTQNQVIAPWLLYELVQLMINLWGGLNDAEVNSEHFEVYTRVLCSATNHLHQAKRIMRETQEKDPKNVRFVGPSRTLSLSLMRQLVATSARFVTDLPDLKDHLNILEMSKVKEKADPSLSTAQWQRRYESMRKLLGEEDVNLPIRQNLHTLLSLAECGV